MECIELTLNISDERPPHVDACVASANAETGQGDEMWRHLWRDPMQKEHLQEINNLVQALQPCRNLLILGIGGSALGTRALHAALCVNGSPTLFVLDNIDPHTFRRSIEKIKLNDPSLSQTVVTVISKSGETAEIAALYMAVQKDIPQATYVAITGQQGTLRAYAESSGWSIFTVPDGVGGRFSILSPVGLFPAAMCGIDIKGLLEGARAMDDQCMKTQHNPAADLAAGLVAAMEGGRTTHVMMPYCDRLVQFAHWYVQLWAESLGKIDSNGNRVGPTPLAAVGTTDQHSMLQLWREGPRDKVIGFLNVKYVDDVSLGENSMGVPQSWLCGQSLGSLLHAERIATEKAVIDAGQATWTMTFPRIDAHSIGQFIALWQVTVAIAGRLLHVNPYDQPGVELGKQLTKDAFLNEK